MERLDNLIIFYMLIKYKIPIEVICCKSNVEKSAFFCNNTVNGNYDYTVHWEWLDNKIVCFWPMN